MQVYFLQFFAILAILTVTAVPKNHNFCFSQLQKKRN